MKDKRKRTLCFSMVSVLIAVATGCSPHSIFNALSEKSGYHFREVKWGFTQERVELSEAGNRPIKRAENALVYETKLNGVPCHLVYTFKDNKLRTAGYISKLPIPNADNIIQKAVSEHGLPDVQADGMIWKTFDTVIYTKAYISARKISRTRHDYARDGLGNPTGGLLGDIVSKDLEDRTPGTLTYLDGVLGYVDKAFFDELHEVRSPLEELSFYEKQLMGIVVRSGGVTIPGLGKIPANVIPIRNP